MRKTTLELLSRDYQCLGPRRPGPHKLTLQYGHRRPR